MGSGNVILLYDEIIGYFHNPVLVITAQLINTKNDRPSVDKYNKPYLICLYRKAKKFSRGKYFVVLPITA